MNSVRLFFGVILISFFTFLGGCSKDNNKGESSNVNKGCMQVNACNYNPNAIEDDGSCFFCADCSGNTLESSELKQSVDINVFDFNPSSNYYNQVFSILTIDWNNDLYCQEVKSNFVIKFRNTTNKNITFDYYIESNANGQLRTAQGLVQNLAPGATFEKKQGQSAFWNLKIYPISVLCKNIIYN
jgi:hypothetical protein